MAWAAIAAAGAKAGGGLQGSVLGFLQSGQEAKTLKKIGALEASEIRRAGRQVGGAQQAAYAKANVRTDVGTPVHVAAATAARAEMAALTRLFSYRQEAYQIKQEALLNMLTSFASAGMQATGTAGRIRWAQGQQPGASAVNTQGVNQSSVNQLPVQYSRYWGRSL